MNTAAVASSMQREDRLAVGQRPALRVLSALVVPPHLSVSGGARAAEQLSAALLPYCDIAVASMMNDASRVTTQVPRVPVRTWLPPLLPWRLLPRHFSTLFYRSDIPERIARGGYDLVHIHNPMPALEMARVAHACRDRGIPYVVSTHGFNEVANGLEIYGFGPLRRQVWRKLVLAPVREVVRHASAVLALSPADLPIVQAMGFRGQPAIVYNGVVMPGAANPDADRAALDRLEIPADRTPGQITCMFLGNHTPNKGLSVLLEAFSRLTDPYLLIVGGETRPAMDYRRFIGTCGPGQRIVVTGRLSDLEVGAMFRRSDLFIFPTLADTFPLAVLEAMSHGLPILASRTGGIPFQIDENCGLLVEPGSSAQLAQAVSSFARTPGRLKAMGECARARVADTFSWEGAAERALSAYHTVV